MTVQPVDFGDFGRGWGTISFPGLNVFMKRTQFLKNSGLVFFLSRMLRISGMTVFVALAV